MIWMRKWFSKNRILGKIPKLFLENLFMLQKTGFKEDILIISLFEKNHFSLLVFYKSYKQNNAFFLMKWNDFINFSEKDRKYPRDSYSTNNSLIQKHDEIGSFHGFLGKFGTRFPTTRFHHLNGHNIPGQIVPPPGFPLLSPDHNISLRYQSVCHL